ncbi:MAG: class I tRNA ligase family protein, partial [Nitrososphaerota archaeon]
NVIWAMDIMGKYGADPLRFYLVSKSAPWDNMNFVEGELKQVVQDLNILWNVFSFALTYFELDKYDPERITVESVSRHLRPEDRWILSKVNSLCRQVTGHLRSLDIHSAARELKDFILEDLSRLYVRSVRRRVWVEEESWDKIAVYATLYYVLKKLVLMLAPITPYLAEKLYQQLRLRDDPESVHLCDWPKPDAELINEEIEDCMEIARITISEAVALRQKHGRKLRWPVKAVILSPRSSRAKKALEKLEDFIKSQINAMELKILEVGERPEGIKIICRPVYERLGPRLGGRVREAAERLSRMNGELIRSELESSGSIKLLMSDGTTVELSEEDLSFEEILPDNLGKIEGRFADIYIDFSETRDIVAQSLAREIIRRVQVMRKELDLVISDYIEATIAAEDEEDLELLRGMREYIMEEVRAKSINLVSGRLEKPEGYVREWMIEGKRYLIAISKIREAEGSR